MSWQDTIIAAHTAVTDAVSHYEKMKSDRYFVWAEEGAFDLEAEGRHAERAMRGTTDLFTKLEDDPWAGALEESFDGKGIAWSLNSTQYEEETGFIHIEWTWEVVNFRNSFPSGEGGPSGPDEVPPAGDPSAAPGGPNEEAV